MNIEFQQEDLARPIALEHAFHALALISASNFARLQGISVSSAVADIRGAIESALYDTADMGTETRDLVRVRLRRMFDHVATMAAQMPTEPKPGIWSS